MVHLNLYVLNLIRHFEIHQRLETPNSLTIYELRVKTLVFSGIRTRTIRIKGEHVDYLTPSAAHFWLYLNLVRK